MLRKRWMLSLFICLAIPWNALGQQRPLRTDDAELLKTGWIRAEFGVEFLQSQRYSLSGLYGDLTRLGVSSIQVGVGDYAEFKISGVFQDFLSVSSRAEQPPISPTFTGNSTSDFGDLILATKLKLAGENRRRPALAFEFGVELPNAKHDSGLGTDQTEFYSSLLFKKASAAPKSSQCRARDRVSRAPRQANRSHYLWRCHDCSCKKGHKFCGGGQRPAGATKPAWQRKQIAGTRRNPVLDRQSSLGSWRSGRTDEI